MAVYHGYVYAGTTRRLVTSGASSATATNIATANAGAGEHWVVIDEAGVVVDGDEMSDPSWVPAEHLLTHPADLVAEVLDHESRITDLETP